MKVRRRIRWSLRGAFAVLTLIAVACAMGPKLWNARLTAPRRIDVRGPGTLNLAGTTLAFPIKPETVRSYYVYDGGTYYVDFVDNADVHHVVASWHPLGEPEHHGEILLGGSAPDEDGRNIGKNRAGEQLIFSVMELEAERYSSATLIDGIYPKAGTLITRFCEEAVHCALWEGPCDG